jgi:L-arabinonolactonase
MTHEEKSLSAITLSFVLDFMLLKEELALVLHGPSEVTARLICDIKCELGECCLYDDATNEILFSDILKRRLYKLCLNTSTLTFRDLPKMLGAFALLKKKEKGYLCAWEDGFEIYDPDSKTSLSSPSIGEDVNPHGLPTRLNDGRCDRSGKNFVCGGYYGDLEGIEMKVFRTFMDENGSLKHHPLVESIRVTNSLCFSPDGKQMYLADSPTRTIFKYDYEDGNISNKTEFHRCPVGVPDGSCIDADGYLWNAIWRDGEGPSFVVRLDPITGKEVFRVNMPDNTSQVSCCCFGGPELNVLFITTARTKRHDTECMAGGLYAIKVPFSGLPESRFQYP